MSIEKKSLISNRSASKKAIVTKPGVTKVSSVRLIKPHMAIPARLHPVRISVPKVR
jgi:hypothetical protein